jgi:hypothetical protein
MGAVLEPKDHAIIKRTRPVPDQAFSDLREWHRQALKYEETKHPTDRPKDRQLLTGWREWPRGLLEEPTILPSGLIRLALKKPKERGEVTTRDLSAAWFFTNKVHCIVGGRLSIEPHGKRGAWYYPRTHGLPGLTLDGKRRRFYVMRLIAGTPAGLLTREPADFHVLGRAEIKAAGQQPKKGDHAKIGRALATRYTLDALREAIERGEPLPTGVDESLIAQMLEDGYRLLDELPADEMEEAAE